MKTVLFLLLATYVCGQYSAPLYAEWAHHHVVWINGRQQNQQKILTLISDYEKHNIKVGGVLIDSDWSTGFNNFEWNLQKFPHPSNIIKTMHSKNIRVILWVTSIINNDTNIYEQAKKNGYLLNGGKLAKWWHGHGGFLDYFNPKAVQWWHKLMDKVLDIGVDGFKCDGTDPITFLLQPWPYSGYAKRPIVGHEYGHQYYGDFYNYSKTKNPEALIMARPTDSFKTYTSWNYAPRSVMFSGWVGDQDSSSDGLRKAMYNVLKSAWHGYLNFGFDIGGYRGQNISKNIFLRWVQVGALLPFMENGGNGKHQPWVFDQQTVDIYRKYVDLHYQLKPTFLTCAAQKYPHKKSTLTPLAAKIPQDTIKVPQNYLYILCDNLLVSPVFEQNGQAEVVFPIGSNWVYYFDHNKVFKGGSRNFYTFTVWETPLFMKSNSVIVLQDQLLVVALNPGYILKQTVLYGAYSDDMTINYSGQVITLKINRFFKNQVESDNNKQTKTVKFIGFKNNPKTIDISVNGQLHRIQNIYLEQAYQWSGQIESQELVQQQ